MQVFSLKCKDGDDRISTKNLRSVMNSLGQKITKAEIKDIKRQAGIVGQRTIDFQ